MGIAQQQCVIPKFVCRKLFTHEILADLEKDTVDWEDNYDGSERIPQVMPTRIPNLLINGTTGIAVGMATNMAPHNMTEVVNACLAYTPITRIFLSKA